MYIKIIFDQTCILLVYMCHTETSKETCFARWAGNINDNQAGSLCRNFIAHADRDKVLKLVSRNEEFCCMNVSFVAALIYVWNVSNKTQTAWDSVPSR